MPSNNPEYQKKYIKKHYQQNKQYYLDKNKKRKEILVPKLKEFVKRYKLLCGCKDCGYKENYIALQFDHIKEKRINVSTAVNRGWSLNMIKNEIRKCEVRCANCHAIKTEERRSNPVELYG